MRYYGYAGQILYVDLSTGESKSEPLDLELARKFIGGFGLSTKLAYDLIPPGIDPLAPENAIIFGAGALAGTMAPGSSRLVVSTKFPETNTVSYGNGSMTFAPRLKFAGYDQLVITGRAAKPVYLRISDNGVELCDASHLWGKDLCETTEELWRTHGTKSSVIAIGQSGENLVKISVALVDETASIGKGGLPAVMGSKNLKAIVVGGSRGIEVADPARFMKAINQTLERVREYPLRDDWIKVGINKVLTTFIQKGIECNDETEVYPRQKANELYGFEVYLNKVKQGRMSCPSCPMGDKEILGVKEGNYKGLVSYASGFTARNLDFGIHCGVDSYDKIVKCMDIANRWGVDIHSFSRCIEYAVHLFEMGVITEADTDGLVLKRDFDTTCKLLEQTAFRKGFGDVLADGQLGLIKKFGHRAEKQAGQIKGLEVAFEPISGGVGSMEFAQVVSPRGGHHQAGGSPAYAPDQPKEQFARHCLRMGSSPEAVARIFDSPFGVDIGRLTKFAEDWYSVLSSLGLCVRAQLNRFYSINLNAELYSAATGIEMTPAELIRTGERAWNLLKASNVKEGFSRKDDRFPDRWFEPIKGEHGEEIRLHHYWGKPLTREDTEKMLDSYYDERGWDKSTGLPTRQKLVELGLADVADDLAPIIGNA